MDWRGSLDSAHRPAQTVVGSRKLIWSKERMPLCAEVTAQDDGSIAHILISAEMATRSWRSILTVLRLQLRALDCICICKCSTSKVVPSPLNLFSTSTMYFPTRPDQSPGPPLCGYRQCQVIVKLPRCTRYVCSMQWSMVTLLHGWMYYVRVSALQKRLWFLFPLVVRSSVHVQRASVVRVWWYCTILLNMFVFLSLSVLSLILFFASFIGIYSWLFNDRFCFFLSFLEQWPHRRGHLRIHGSRFTGKSEENVLYAIERKAWQRSWVHMVARGVLCDIPPSVFGLSPYCCLSRCGGFDAGLRTCGFYFFLFFMGKWFTTKYGYFSI